LSIYTKSYLKLVLGPNSYNRVVVPEAGQLTLSFSHVLFPLAFKDLSSLEVSQLTKALSLAIEVVSLEDKLVLSIF